MTQPNELDETAQRFLGASEEDIAVHKGQEVTEDHQQAIYEQELWAESCEFGDDLVRYVAMHQDLSPEAGAWGFCLAVYCVRTVFPNGVSEFDDLCEQADKDLTLAQTTVITDTEEIARIQTDLPQFTKNRLQEAADFSEVLQTFVQRKKRQIGISNRQGAYGLGRAFHNLRKTFPRESGSSAAFDELARRAGQYYADNKEKA